MTNKKTNSIVITSPDLREERIDELKRLFPDMFDGEGNLDEKALRNLAAPDGISTTERFRFEWAGKLQSKRKAFTPSRATLVADPERSVDFDNTQNMIIEGDNLEALKLLQNTYFERVKCIYIDPPYNKDADVIYPDDYSETKKAYWQKNGTIKDGVKLTAVTESNGRKHSIWLNIMQSRLLLARQLLRHDGVIFISIGEDEVSNLRKLCDEIFGEENFIECIAWNKRIPKNDKGIGNIHEYILVYVKDVTIKHEFTMRKDGLDDIYDLVKKLKNKKVSLKDSEVEIKRLYKKNDYDRGITLYNSMDEDYRLWGKINMSWPNANTFGTTYEVLHPITNKPVKIPDRGWRWKEETFDDASKRVDGKYKNIVPLHDGSFMCGKIWFAKDENTQPSSITYLDEVKSFLLRSILSMKSDGGVEVENLFDGKSYFSYPKPTSLLTTLFSSQVTGNDDLYIDFFAGSGTSADSLMNLNVEDGGNRRYILVQLPEYTDEKSEAFKAGYKTISSLCIERVRRATEKLRKENPKTKTDTGFRVYCLTDSHFSQNLFTPDLDKSDAEKTAALEEHLKANRQGNLFGEETFNDVVAEISLKNGYGLFYDLEKLDAFPDNAVYKLTGNGKSTLLCLDDPLSEKTIDALQAHSDEQLIIARRSLDTTKKWTLQSAFKDNLHTV
ncbi:MAG: site-specific DNA-methyltransferase [Alphaproteobacteria bacterium]|nr:site-specific DNA-methyltransferase [Alphaproteobacteria bacterium]